MSVLCRRQDPETGECRAARCSCDPPRCPMCGRFTHDWGTCSEACTMAMFQAEEDDLRRSVEEQGLIP